MYKLMYMEPTKLSKAVNITSYIETRKNTKNLYFVMRYPADVTHIFGDRESKSLKTPMMSIAKDRAWVLYERMIGKINGARNGVTVYDLTERRTEAELTDDERSAIEFMFSFFNDFDFKTAGSAELTIKLLTDYQNMKSRDMSDTFDTIAKDTGIFFDETTPLYAAVKDRFHQQFLKLWAKMVQTNQVAQITNVSPDNLLEFETANFADATKPLVRPMHTVTELWTKYLEDELGAKSGKRQEEENTRFGNYVRDFALFVNNPPANYVTREHVSDFFVALSKIPARKTVPERKMSFLELVAHSHNRERITHKAAIEWYSRLSRFFKWIEEKYRDKFDVKNPFDGMKKFVKGEEGTEKRGWEKQELIELFNQQEFTAGAKRDSFFWSVLCALTHGNRLSEFHERSIDQLIQHEQGFWYIHVSEGKNGSSIRKVPISDIVIRAGFLEWVEANKKAGAQFLFPDENHDDPDSRDFSRKFGKWCNRRGIYNPERTFHNFRDTFLSNAYESEMPREIMDPPMVARRISGHANADVHEDYIRSTLPKMKKVVDAVVIEGFPYDRFK